MKKSVKDTLKSVIVLLSIAFVCVAVLSVANEFLKYEAKLDSAMAKQLYKVCPTGEETDKNALEYFEMVSADKEIDKVNGKTSSGAKVVAVYRATKGTNAGCYIIQAQAQGRDSAVVMLTSYTLDGKVMKSTCYSQAESYWDAKIAGRYDDFATLTGQSGKISGSDIAVDTGATMSINAVAKAVTVSNEMVEYLSFEPFRNVLSANAYDEVTQSLTDKISATNATAPDENTKVLQVYQAVGGEYDGCYIVISQSKTNKWYAPLQMMTGYDKNGKIVKTQCIFSEDSYYDSVDKSSFDNAIGKSGQLPNDTFVATGATQSRDSHIRAVNIANKLIENLLAGGDL